MSRYAIVTDNENIEMLLGFDEALNGFFLTIEDVTKSDGEPESFLFHNMVHHPGVGMTFEQLTDTLLKFGIALPTDLLNILAREAGGAAGIPEIADPNPGERVPSVSQLRPTTWKPIN